METSEAGTEDVRNDDAGQRYADKVNAPLSRETLEVLRAELESEEHARYRRASRRDKATGP